MPRTDETIALKRRGFFEIVNNDGQVTSSQLQAWATSRANRKIREGNWDRAKPKVLSPTPYYHFNRRMYSAIGTVNTYVRGGMNNLRDHPYYFAFPPTATWRDDSSALFNEAMLKALQNLKDQKWNAGVAIAEASGIAQMLVDSGRVITQIRKDFVQGDLRSAYNRFRRKYPQFMSWSAFKRRYGKSLNRAQLASGLPNAWLYYHLGIKPTVNDLHQAHSSWIEAHAGNPQSWETQVVFGQAKMTSKPVTADKMAGWACESELEATQIQSCRVYLYVRPTEPALAKLSRLGATNVPEAVWNGLPFSFVADYFFSIGDWLSSLDAGIGWQFLPYVRSHRLVRDYKDTTWVCTASRGGWVAPQQKYRCKEFELDRRVVSNLYPPMFDVLPRIKLRGPGMHQVSIMLSLLGSVFGGKTPPGSVTG